MLILEPFEVSLTRNRRSSCQLQVGDAPLRDMARSSPYQVSWLASFGFVKLLGKSFATELRLG